MTNKTFLAVFTWLQNQGIMYLKCLYLRICLPSELNSVHCVHIKKFSLRAAVVPSRSITASMLGMSDRWICSKTFKAFLLHLSSECSLVCNVNVAINNINGFDLYFSLRGLGVALATLATP